ncbi:MAG TPA: GAF domain-containing protein [Beijerinckiaceae bacterium]|nr:GAF domain-containing protein [Beijerinckiaceae bacterium]
MSHASASHSTSPDLDEQLAQIVQSFRADSGTVHILQADGLLHLAAATPGIPEPVLATIARIPVGKGMAGLAVERGCPVDACNIQTDTSGDVRPGAKATGLAGAIVVPIFRGDATIGALGIGNRGERTFTAAEAQELIAAGRRLAVRAEFDDAGGAGS